LELPPSPVYLRVLAINEANDGQRPTVIRTWYAKLEWNKIFGHKMKEFYEASSASSHEALFALFYKFVFCIFRILGTFGAPSWVIRSVASLEDSKSRGCLSKQKHRRGEHPECANMKRQLSLLSLFVAPCYEPILSKQTNQAIPLGQLRLARD